MKTRAVILLLSLLAISAVLVSTANACSSSNTYYSQQSCSWPELPDSPVTLTITSGAYQAPITIVLSNVPSGYDITNTAYNGWCVDLLATISPQTPYSAMITSSLNQYGAWNYINYILNNKQGTSEDVQAAIWLIQGFTADQIKNFGHIEVTAAAWKMYRLALMFGRCFVPVPGQIVALICTVQGCQTTIIEVYKESCCTWNVCWWNWRYTYRNFWYYGCGYH